ncbi:MAG: ERAP1-like C-terminal domain-containing protein [Acidobacteria bacterium]|nr:ERAP1-like C-terminal domain-containing protein [Acidobacteriota bacterium]
MRKYLLPAILLITMTTISQPRPPSATLPPIEPGVSLELAKWRAERYSDVRYKLNLTLEKMSPVLKGTIEIRVVVRDAATTGRGDAGISGQPTTGTQASPPASARGAEIPPIILDWRKIKGHEEKSTISNVSINGRAVVLENHPVTEAATPLLRKEGSLAYREENEHLVFRDGVVAGENVIKLDFTSPILTSGSAITRYIDKEDGSEYIYSLFVPSDASTAFPVFDQPDLKARFQLDLRFANGWNVVSNTAIRSVSKAWCDDDKPCLDGAEFHETKPMSTYVFAFAAGPFEAFVDAQSGTNYLSSSDRERYKKWADKNVISISDSGAEKFKESTFEKSPPKPDFTTVYVRKSQAAKFKPHAAEVFRLNREAIRYFEEYFDYKFPFPKYDLVLIPEFPFGGMEHAGATFLRESSIIFPQEPTRNDHISRALLIFHEASHQWFGDTVTMRWFDDLWLKEGFATFTAYKAMERIMPEMMAWKVFYERVKQAAYQTDSTRGTTAIYQPIANLSAAKSAYGNIVYNKAPTFLRQAEFYLGEDKFQTAVRAFLKKHEFGNAGWEDLVRGFEVASKQDLKEWANVWVKRPGLPKISNEVPIQTRVGDFGPPLYSFPAIFRSSDSQGIGNRWQQRSKALIRYDAGDEVCTLLLCKPGLVFAKVNICDGLNFSKSPEFIFPNYGDYGYGIFLPDEKSRDYVLKNIQNEKDPFLRSMMWGALWDSVREGELDPSVFIETAIRNLPAEQDETMSASIAGRVGTALNYYVSDKTREELAPRIEKVFSDKMRTAPTLGQRITFYRAFLNVASSENARSMLKAMLSEPPASAGGQPDERENHPVGEAPTPLLRKEGSQKDVGTPAVPAIPLKTKDRFDIVTRLLILGDPDAPRLLAELEKTETSDDAKRYAYAARAGIATAENKAKYWKDFTENKEISESWIEAAFGPWNSIRHSELTLPYLERALKELPNHKRNRKIFFVNGWLGAFISGQRSEEALATINKFLADNPSLDRDLRLKILENADLIEWAVKIRARY